MKKKTLLSLALLGALLISSPSHAFLNIDSLEQELEAIDAAEESDEVRSGLDALLQGLGDVKEEQASTVSFPDVPKTAWFYTYVNSVASRGIVSGYQDTGMYGPGDPVTIAQMLKIGLEAAEVDKSACKENPRHSAARSHWAKQYVACAEHMNMRIIQTEVDLNRPALRGEVVGIIHDAFGVRPPAGVAPFSDTRNHPYERDIAYAASNGVVSGDTGKNTFRPNDGVNRAEAAKVVHEQLGQS